MIRLSLYFYFWIKWPQSNSNLKLWRRSHDRHHDDMNPEHDAHNKPGETSRQLPAVNPLPAPCVVAVCLTGNTLYDATSWWRPGYCTFTCWSKGFNHRVVVNSVEQTSPWRRVEIWILYLYVKSHFCPAHSIFTLPVNWMNDTAAAVERSFSLVEAWLMI